ncbi:carbohydrate kinase family protein [Oceanotoga teriensis]|uniref:Fructokinase n=1 Tax=Oceanotoga teriensis TaxID=515440 RepID=A0AA45C4L8_9BACT|nr:sugar kinase [Oceanotoga teriensis]MDO7977858.1 sugar kinase [Oceanotoga teriensis]PWJ86813.1 fructokinase [Oceanotoga teriensis]
MDFISYGEVLIDLISSDYIENLKDSLSFKKYFGGSPANICINLSKLNVKTALISKIGNDPFGNFILEKLKKNNINTSGITISEDNNTDIVTVLKSKKTPKFHAYRSSSLNLELNDKALNLVSQSKILHISSWALSTDHNLKNTFNILKKAKENNLFIGFDPNYRKILWKSSDNIINILKKILPYINLIKPSEDDCESIFGKNTLDSYINEFFSLGAKNIVLTLGEKGAIYINNKNKSLKIPSTIKEVIDTTGAGDAFWSGIYYGIMNNKTIEDSLYFGRSFAEESLKNIGAEFDISNLKKL